MQDQCMLTAHNQGFTPKSKLGIVSFVIGSVTAILLVITISVIAPFFAYIAQLSMGGSISPDELHTEIEAYLMKSSVVASGILFLFVEFALFLAGLIIGLISLFSKDKNRLFPILGIVFNGLPIAMVILVIFIGSFAS